jgi:hypothetical protein
MLLKNAQVIYPLEFNLQLQYRTVCGNGTARGFIMRTLLIIAFLLPTVAFAQSKAPDTCYAAFPGAKGKKCCDASYARRAQGSMSNDERMAELGKCTGKK